ncbi:MAG: nickel pincer cofactor biosynthesis protein LarB [Candidatus Dormibacteraceae bacterium]
MRDVLRRLVAGEITEDEALSEIRSVQLDELGGRARLDLGRYLRRGLPEVVLASGKSPLEAARLAIAMAEHQGQGLISRMTGSHRAALDKAARAAGMTVIAYQTSARVLRQGFDAEAVGGRVGILTAGTSDVPVAEEARMVVEASGIEARLAADLGVAGLHRFVGPLAAALEWGADVLVVAAGMDGVLPGLVAGLTDVPVIGLPVSTGYGRGGAGEAALTTMLQSCSTGLAVVNIDNGVGAGAAAALIAARAAQGRRRGRSEAIKAKTSAPTSRTPRIEGASARQASGPPGTAKVRARAASATSTPAKSHGKPRRRRP